MNRTTWFQFVVAIVSTLLASNCSATTYVEYSGDALPEHSTLAFQFNQGRTEGPRSVHSGILTLENPDSSGSQEYERNDAMLVDDLVVQQFRVRLIDPVSSTSSIYRGAVTHFQFGDASSATAEVLVFVLKDVVRLRQIERTQSGTSFIQSEFGLDTEVFHTYTLVREQQSLRLFVDGSLAIQQENAVVGLPRSYAPVQRFQANPYTVSEWDFFRYAIGPEALELISIPEPTSLLLSILVSCSLILQRQRGSKRAE